MFGQIRGYCRQIFLIALTIRINLNVMTEIVIYSFRGRLILLPKTMMVPYIHIHVRSTLSVTLNLYNSMSLLNIRVYLSVLWTKNTKIFSKIKKNPRDSCKWYHCHNSILKDVVWFPIRQLSIRDQMTQVAFSWIQRNNSKPCRFRKKKVQTVCRPMYMTVCFFEMVLFVWGVMHQNIEIVYTTQWMWRQLFFMWSLLMCVLLCIDLRYKRRVGIPQTCLAHLLFAHIHSQEPLAFVIIPNLNLVHIFGKGPAEVCL